MRRKFSDRSIHLAALCLSLAACNAALDRPGGSCSSATSAELCDVAAGCVLDVCANGEFVGCLEPGSHFDPCSTAQNDCSSAQDTATCDALAGCTTQTCPVGCTSATTFASCAPTGAQPPQCPDPPPCHPMPCDDITDAQTCESRSDCHSLYQQNSTCACAGTFCCGGAFSSCATGPTNCFGPDGALGPPAVCGGTTYVSSYSPQGQVDGCTLASECPGYCGIGGAGCQSGEYCCASPADPGAPSFCSTSECAP